MMLKMSAKLVAVVIFLSCGAQCYLQGINWVNEKRGEAAVDADDKGANQRVRRALKDTARAQAVRQWHIVSFLPPPTLYFFL